MKELRSLTFCGQATEAKPDLLQHVSQNYLEIKTIFDTVF